MGAGTAFFGVPPRAAGWQPARRATGHMPPSPTGYDDTSLSHCAPRTGPDQPRLSPLQNPVPWSSGCQPPARRLPGLSHVWQRPHMPSALGGRAASGAPRASGTPGAAPARPGGATATHTSGGPLAPAPALNRPQPAGASAARLGLTWGGRPARQTYSCPETALT